MVPSWTAAGIYLYAVSQLSTILTNAMTSRYLALDQEIMEVLMEVCSSLNCRSIVQSGNRRPSYVLIVSLGQGCISEADNIISDPPCVWNNFLRMENRNEDTLCDIDNQSH
jgi:hypothetical protein